MTVNILKVIRRVISKKYYAVGIIEDSSTSMFTSTKERNVHWLKYPGYKKNWIADPFIFRETEENIYLFAEQWIEKKKKGILVLVSVSKSDYSVLSIDPILELDTHLSFPAIIRENGNTYVYPENSKSGNFCIYTYNEATKKLENPKVLIESPLLDVQIIRYNSYYYALGILDSGTPDDYKTLYIYSSQDLLGPYKLAGQINHSEKIARGAGNIITYKEQIIRPAQDCKLDYGKAVIFFALSLNNPYQEEVMSTIYPDVKYPEGLHTYNKGQSITVIDGIKYNFGNFVSFLKKINK